MSLGIKSLWRARSRCCNGSGLSLISRDLVPSRVPRPLSGHLCLQFKSTARPNVLPTDNNKPLTSDTQKHPSRAQLLESLGVANTTEGQIEERNDARARPKNHIFKDAFKMPLQDVEDHVARNLHKSFVSTARNYPNHAATRASLREHLVDTRRQVGHSIVWEHFDTKVVEWSECFNLMKDMTPKWSNRTDLSAVRIVLPKSWDIEVNNQNLEYVDSATGVLRKLRTSVDMNPSAIVLRGKSSVLAAAADEIVRFCKQAEVYELGELKNTDYKMKQLWPAIEGAPGGDAPLSKGNADNIWVHKEYQPHTLAMKYEDVPKPAEWTMENFEKYIATLTYGRIPADLAISLYAKPGQFGRRVDTEGIRIRLIMEAFEDGTAQPFITASLLKMALSSMASRGGHRSQASRLIELAEKWGVPMDTDVLNIMLESYVTKHDATFFYKFLRRMKTRYHHLNIRTWLLFLQLTKREDEKRQVVVAMYELGMFNHTETRRGIAEGLASFDAYAAFKAGSSLDSFLRDQEERYGTHWISVEAVNKIIVELLRFHRKESPRLKECKKFIEMQQLAGQKCDLITINTALREAAAQQDWSIAHWAMSLFDQFGCEPDQETYQHLMKLCIDSHSPHALGTLYFYGVLDRKLATRSREMLREVLLRTHEHSFWKRYQPGIFPKDVLKGLYENPIGSRRHIMSRIERVILEKWHGYTPTKSLAYALQLAYRTNDIPLRRQISAGRHDPKVRVLALKLKRTDGKEGKTIVRIVATFKPERMIGRPKKKGAAEGSAEASTELSESLEVEDLIDDPWEEEFTDYVDLDTIRIIEEKLATSNKSPMEKATKVDSKAKKRTTVAKDESSQSMDAATSSTLQQEAPKPKRAQSKTVEVN